LAAHSARCRRHNATSDREVTLAAAAIAYPKTAGVCPIAAAHIHRAGAAEYVAHSASCIRHSAVTDREAASARVAYGKGAGVCPITSAHGHCAVAAGAVTHIADCIRQAAPAIDRQAAVASVANNNRGAIGGISTKSYIPKSGVSGREQKQAESGCEAEWKNDEVCFHASGEVFVFLIGEVVGILFERAIVEITRYHR
jgi:hypothetical protein